MQNRHNNLAHRAVNINPNERENTFCQKLLVLNMGAFCNNTFGWQNV